MPLVIETHKWGPVTIIDLSGRITLGEGTGMLRDAVRKSLDAGDRNIVLNLADVSYVDSAGLGELVGSFTSVTHAGGRLKLLKLQAKMIDLMQVTKLHTVFEVYESEADCVKSFGV